MFSIEDEKQVVELVRLMGETFIARRDVKAIQGDDGAWMPVTARHGPHNPEKGFVPFTMHDFKMHLEGVSSYGHYLLDTDNNTKLFAFDLDVMQPTASNGRTWTNVDGEPFNPRESWLAQDGHHGPISVQLLSLAMALIFAIEDIFGDDVRVLMCDTGGIQSL